MIFKHKLSNLLNLSRIKHACDQLWFKAQHSLSCKSDNMHLLTMQEATLAIIPAEALFKANVKVSKEQLHYAFEGERLTVSSTESSGASSAVAVDASKSASWLSSSRVLKVVALLGGVVAFSNVSYAKCLEISDGVAVPHRIEADQCYELQGGNEFSGQTIVLGKLFVKAGRSATLNSHSNIVLGGDGVLEIRGSFEMRPNSQISLNGNASLTNTGEIIMQNTAAIGATGSPNIRNLGRMIMDSLSRISLTGETTFKNSGELSMTGAIMLIDNKSTYTNVGTNYADLGAAFTFKNDSRFFNQGRTLLAKNSQMTFQGNSKAESRRQMPVDGRISFNDNSIFENYALFKLQTPGQLNFGDSSQLLNNHTIELRGKAKFYAKARILNDGTVAVKQGASVHTMQNALFINNGTFRNEGGGFTIDNQNNFLNQSIISGGQSRSQGHDRLESKAEENIKANEKPQKPRPSIKERENSKDLIEAKKALDNANQAEFDEANVLPEDLSPDAMATDLSHNNKAKVSAKATAAAPAGVNAANAANTASAAAPAAAAANAASAPDNAALVSPANVSPANVSPATSSPAEASPAYTAPASTEAGEPSADDNVPMSDASEYDFKGNANVNDLFPKSSQN